MVLGKNNDHTHTPPHDHTAREREGRRKIMCVVCSNYLTIIRIRIYWIRRRVVTVPPNAPINPYVREGEMVQHERLRLVQKARL